MIGEGKALIKEEWPSVPGHAGETKVYTVHMMKEYKDYILAKRRWYSRKKMYIKNGMFVKVLEIEVYV